MRTLDFVHCERNDAWRDTSSPDDDSCSWSQSPQQLQHRRLRHGDAACGWTKIVAGQVQEHRAAAAGDAGPRVVVDLDDEIIEMVGALEPVTPQLASAPDPLVI